ncbi:MAG: tRNA epoxyqueuosine(34) reductase QueG [Rhodospirillaceae bacterium]
MARNAGSRPGPDPGTNPDPQEVAAAIRAEATRLGFDGVAFARARLPEAERHKLAQDLSGWLGPDKAGAGEMGWMAETEARRRDPQVLWPEAVSIIALSKNYGPPEDAAVVMDRLSRADRGTISVYARNRDYHDVLKKAGKALCRFIHGRWGAGVKIFVDTAPVMEKPHAARAGLGWQGKHTNLVSREYGSWLFLAEVFTTLTLPPDPPHPDRCGSCAACLAICPTGALPAPYQIDATACLSYLTIEHRGPIPRQHRVALGNRIYGCDDCLAVCPWNRFARRTAEPAFLPRIELTAPRLADLAGLDDAGFRAVFQGSPIKRIGRTRFVRNVLIALGNMDKGADSSSRGRALAAIHAALDDPEPVLRGAAVWALSRWCRDTEAFQAARDRYYPKEGDAMVRAEWDAPDPETPMG